ncbi:MAG: response regulator [bacterium]
MQCILVIDDEPGIRITFSKMLEREGYAVRTASDLNDVQEMLKNHSFDVIISDIFIPGTNGIELLKLMKQHFPETPVIMITGEPNIDTAIESVRQGAYDYLSKPITRQQLCQVVGRAVEKKWLTDERKRLEEENLKYQRELESKVRERTIALEELNTFVTNVIESISSALITLDLSGNITMVNTHALELLGIENKDHILGGNYRTVFPPDLVQAMHTIFHEEDWNTSHEFELQKQTIGYTISLLLDNEQKVKGNVLVMRDISEKKRLEQELIQSEKLATMGLLAGKISHEMGNPLFGIMGYAELLESKYPKEKNIRFIINQALRLKKMTKDLLTISKPKPPLISAVDINQVLKDTMDFLREITGQIKYHEVLQEYAQNLPSIQGDAEQLKQVFVNLIVNASQAMRNRIEGSVLTIGTALAEGGQKVLIYVQDNGCGIAPEDLDRIFDPFYTTKGDEGTGLGMAVIKEIVHKHHGQIHIESKVGEGTRASVILPVERMKDLL